MLNRVPNRPLDQPPFPSGLEETFNWEARLSLEFIRSHAKIDDIPGVLDDQIRLYRDSALAFAQEYTGLLLTGTRTVEEPIEGPTRDIPHASRYAGPYGPAYTSAPYYTHSLQYPCADGYVYLYGGNHVNDSTTILVRPGTRKIKVPIRKDFIDMSNCCDPCSSWHVNGGMMAAYKAGYKTANDIPAPVIHGMLQFITWSIDHPGDELLTQRNRIETRAGLAGLQGSNNIAMISGAIETWRSMDPEAW